MRPIVVTVGPLVAPAANNICLSQTPAAAGAMLLNGSLVAAGVAILDTARRILFTPAGADAAKSVVISGTDWAGNLISETLTLANAPTTVYTVLDYKTVTSIVVSAALAGAITVGTNGIASSPWVRMDDFAPSNIAIQCTVSGTVNSTVQSTLDNPNDMFTTPIARSAVTWVSSSDTDVVGATATKQSNFLFAPTYARVLLNSQTNPGFVVATFLQSSNVPL